jgi:hypothetical protein
MNMLNLSVQNGEIKSDIGETIAYMERQPGENTLSPIERDGYCMILAAAPDLLTSLIRFTKAWNNEAAPTTMTMLFNEAMQAIDKAGATKLMQETKIHAL